MRNLKTKDLFTFSKMLNRMGLKEDFKDLLGDKEATNVGLTIIMSLIEKLPEAEKEFYEFVSPIAEKTSEEMEELNLNELMETLKAIMKDESVASFFK